MKRNLLIALVGILAIVACKKTNPVTNPVPKAAFTTDKSSYYLTEPITFTNTSVNAVSYSWNFGDGQKSTERIPTHAFTSQGTYNVVLTVNNSVTASKSIKIFNGSASYQVLNLTTLNYTLNSYCVDTNSHGLDSGNIVNQLNNYILAAGAASDTVFTSESTVFVNASGNPIGITTQTILIPYINNIAKLQ